VSPLLAVRRALFPVRGGSFNAPLLIVLLLAAALRLQNLGAVEHNIDHAYPIWQALRTLDQGALPLTAQETSVLFANPPLTGYLFLLPVALTRSAVGAYLLVISLSVVGIFLAHQTAARLFNPPTALITAFLMAVNPWLVEYSRTTWVQALLPFLVPLVFWLFVALWLGHSARPGRRTLFAFGALAATVQTYLLAYFLLVPVVVLTVILGARLPRRMVVIGATLIVAVTAPYAVGLAAQSAQTSARLNTFSSGPLRLSLESWEHTARLVTGREYAAARGREAPVNDWEARYWLSEAAHYALLLALMVGVALTVRDLRHRAHRPRAVICLVWLLLPPLAMTVTSRPVHPFYLLLALPVGHLIAARALSLSLRTRPLQFAAATAAALFALLMSLNALRYAEETRQLPGAHSFTALPLESGLRLAAELIGTTQQTVFAEAHEYILSSFAGRVVRIDSSVQPPALTVIPPDGALYLSFQQPGDDNRAAAPFGAQIGGWLTLHDGTAVTAHTIDATTARALAEGDGVPSDSGLTFLGAERADAEAVLLRFRVDALTADRAAYLYGPFLHAFDGSGARLAIVDGAVRPGALWEVGELHIYRLTLPEAARGAAWLEGGLYDGTHSRNALFTLSDGTVSVTLTLDVR
jgi:4-amino-4-deoxy-L-arabinose transferase-like glycosyltransferase